MGTAKGTRWSVPETLGPAYFPSSEFDHARAKVILQESARQRAAADAGSDVGRLRDCKVMGKHSSAYSPSATRCTVVTSASAQSTRPGTATKPLSSRAHKGPHNALQLLHRSRQAQAATVSNISSLWP